MPRDHLPAEAHAEKRRVLLQRHADEVDLLAHPVVGIVDAHRPAEDHRARVAGKRFRQRIAVAGAAHVEFEAHRVEQAPDARRAGMLLMQDDQNAPARRVMTRAHVFPPPLTARPICMRPITGIEKARGCRPDVPVSSLLKKPGTMTVRPFMKPA